MGFNYRIWTLSCTACFAAFFFGYDIGFIGGATTLQSFQRDFGLNPSNVANVSGNIVASMQAGCIFGALAIAFLTDRIGRRLGLIISGAVITVASMMQTVSVGRLGLLYAGRVIAGFAVGSASTLVPLYVGETAPKDVRGRLSMSYCIGTERKVTLYSFFTFLGLSVAYWVDYACEKTLSPDGHEQWRIPVALQMVPAFILSVGMIPLRESPRWLAIKGRHEEALNNLAYIRLDDAVGPETRDEYNEIRDNIGALEMEAGGVRLKELWIPRNRKRVLIGLTLMVSQQLTGTTVFTYYAPIFFVQVGIKGSDTGLFATGIYGIVKTVFSMVFLLFFIDKFGRRPLLLWGGLFMGVVMLVNACVLATHPVDEGSSEVAPEGMAMIVMIYLFCVAYSGSWGPVPWTYIGEIFPNRIREYCIAVCSGALWAANFLMSKIIPIAIEDIGWRTFLMFAILNFVVVVFVFFFVRETKGVPLEGMDDLFSKRPVFDTERDGPHATKDGLVGDPDSVKGDDIRGDALHIDISHVDNPQVGKSREEDKK